MNVRAKHSRQAATSTQLVAADLTVSPPRLGRPALRTRDDRGERIRQMAARLCEVRIDELCASTGRVCGDCSLCCKLLPIAEPELNKPANRWCQHCRPAKGGCSIHDDRPPICRGFACMWLVCPLGDEWRPTRSKMVVSENRSPDPVFNIHVEPGSPDIWRREPYYQRIKTWAHAALHNDPQITLRVVIGGRIIVVLPDEEHELDPNRGPYQVLLLNGRWSFFQYRNAQEAARITGVMERLREETAAWSDEDRAHAAKLLRAQPIGVRS